MRLEFSSVPDPHTNVQFDVSTEKAAHDLFYMAFSNGAYEGEIVDLPSGRYRLPGKWYSIQILGIIQKQASLAEDGVHHTSLENGQIKTYGSGRFIGHRLVETVDMSNSSVL